MRRNMAITCKYCGKDLEVVAYRQLASYCSLTCSRKAMREHRAKLKTKFDELREEKYPKQKA